MGRTMSVVLFTDLVGSTELRARLGEEAAEELRRRHDRLLTEAVERHGGRVVKGLGDGIMATFTGASDAVAAAVAIQQAVDRLNRSGKTPVRLAVRVGLSAGDVAFEDDDVHGTPVIEASRLCAAAAGGEVFVSEVVRLLAGAAGSGGFAERGPLELKGLAAPLSTWEVRWERAPASTIPMPALLSDVGRIFVGRDAELERLGQLWKETAAGERRVALLAGEPGVGKTRLAAALAIHVHDAGSVVLAGRCDEDMGVPYQPFVEALRHFVDHTPTDELAQRLGRWGGELSRLVPELGEIAGLAAPLRSDPETERYRLFDAVAAWLAEVSGEAPVLLVLDDLHWAAKPTLLLLRHLFRFAEPLRVLIVVTYRDSDIGRGNPMSDFLGDLRRESGVDRIALSGLDTPSVAAFIEAAAGHGLGDEEQELPRVVWRETDGNPFFVAEVLRHLSESGAIEQREGRWTLSAAVHELGIPEGVRDVVGRRLSRLSAEANGVLRCASVAGVEFEPAIVQTAGGLGEDTVLSALEEAVAARLLIEVPGPAPRNRFAHALVRATLYDELTAARRVALHRRVAEAIEARHAGDLKDYLPALAHHWALASAPTAETTKAVDYAAQAGDRALAQLAHDEAVTYYRQALDLLDAAGAPAGDRRRVELLISLGEAQLRAGDPGHRQTLLDAAALADRSGDVDALARAALANSRGFFSTALGVDPERVTVLERAVGALDRRDTPVAARLIASLADELGFSTQQERRQQLADEALATARRLDDPATLAHVLTRRSVTLPATFERHREMVELGEVAARLGDPTAVCWAHVWRSLTHLAIGDAPGFFRDLDDAVRLADELGEPSLRWVAGYVQSSAYRMAGRLDDAEIRGRQACELGRAAGMPDARMIFFGANLFWVRYDQGRLGELLDRFERAASRPGPNPEPASLALIYGELGRIEAAHRILETMAVDEFAAVPGNHFRIYSLAIRAELCTVVADRRHAATLHRLLAPFRGQVATSGGAAPGVVDHQLASLCTVLGRFDEADNDFQSAARLDERLAAPTWLARTRLEWARMLLTRRGSGDADRARELLGQALATARELSLSNVERRAVRLLQECP